MRCGTSWRRVEVYIVELPVAGQHQAVEFGRRTSPPKVTRTSLRDQAPPGATSVSR